jgi:hypothetical protein
VDSAWSKLTLADRLAPALSSCGSGGADGAAPARGTSVPAKRSIRPSSETCLSGVNYVQIVWPGVPAGGQSFTPELGDVDIYGATG